MFPAPAGINRIVWDKCWIGTGVPRASGDKPSYKRGILAEFPCSPRQRG
ncbi:hypothetical protein C0224_000917 [Escherichia coli]|nr:hypothetical protein [Escherichia coli]EED0739365.1 hypothetical protein [Escherichia coli]EED0981882.1 hypothetical protein [Escherichia coli]EEQ2760115.1 hypothetical protein [Escherichia coli]EEQ4837583.1 hypothetical protein [Escherichia coli]